MKTIFTIVLFLCVGTFGWITLAESKQRPPAPPHFSILDVAIGYDNFATLQSKLGPVKRCHTKEHDGVEIAGYTNSQENLVFEFGHAGGGDVTGFYLGRGLEVGCPLSQLPAKTLSLATNAGVHLGMTREQFLKVFGSPKTRKGDLWKYDWTFEEKSSEEERTKASKAGTAVPDTYLVGINIEARFEGSILRYFYISKLETT
jgi:hypothetical protein